MTRAHLARAARGGAATATLALAAWACNATGEGPANIESPRGAAVISLAMAPESFQVDRVGAGDGALDPDGVPDAVFRATVDGPANAIVLLALDAHGDPIGQWDTLTGEDRLPRGEGLVSPNGDTTLGLVVSEGATRLTHNDGSMTPLAAGRHELELTAELRDVPQAKSVQLVLARADGSLVRGPAIALRMPTPTPARKALPGAGPVDGGASEAGALDAGPADAAAD